MATERIVTTFQLKRGISKDWYNKNPILAQGEPGFEIDTGKLKIGNGFTPWNDLAYTNDINIPLEIDKVKPYLYKIYYNNIDYDYAFKYFNENNIVEPIGCTAVRKNGFFGRNLDWLYNNDATFVVYLPRRGSKFASIGVTGSINKLTEEFVTSGVYSTMYKIVPFRIVDGINEFGVTISTNVVPTDKGYNTYTIPEVEERLKLNSNMIPRYVLDNFKSAAAAVNYLKDYVNVSIAYSMQKSGYEVHFMIADTYETYLVEFINNKIVVVNMTEESGSSLQGKTYMTNFYLSDILLNSDNKVYTPYTQDKTHNAYDTNKITKKGAGLERYNYIADNFNIVKTKYDMINLMKNLYYTKAYQSSLYEEDEHWCSEFTGLNNPDKPGQILTVDTPYDDFIEVLVGAEYIYNNRSREEGSEFYGTWQTVHTSVYDINKRKLHLISQEDNEELEFSLDGFDNLWEYGSGKYSIQPIGTNSHANADYSTVDGAENITIAGADYSHAGGFRTTTVGPASDTHGAYTITNNECESAFGKHNISHTSGENFGSEKNTLFSIGNGNIAPDQGKNIFEVMQNGDVYLAGVGNYEGNDFSNVKTVQEVINDTSIYMIEYGSEIDIDVVRQKVSEGRVVYCRRISHQGEPTEVEVYYRLSRISNNAPDEYLWFDSCFALFDDSPGENARKIVVGEAWYNIEDGQWGYQEYRTYKDWEIDQKVASVTHAASDLISEHNGDLNAHAMMQEEIRWINQKIPDQASSDNKLADKNFVNSSIATNTANFVGTYNSLAELIAHKDYIEPLTNNDYGFVVEIAQGQITAYKRYKYVADTEKWNYEYTLNNSSFTAEQWASINSGITADGYVKEYNGQSTYKDRDAIVYANKNGDDEFLGANIADGSTSGCYELVQRDGYGVAFGVNKSDYTPDNKPKAFVNLERYKNDTQTTLEDLCVTINRVFELNNISQRITPHWNSTTHKFDFEL